MKPHTEHAPNCNCDRCAPECGASSAGSSIGVHGCIRTAPHKGKHKCCCGEKWAK